MAGCGFRRDWAGCRCSVGALALCLVRAGITVSWVLNWGGFMLTERSTCVDMMDFDIFGFCKCNLKKW